MRYTQPTIKYEWLAVIFLLAAALQTSRHAAAQTAADSPSADLCTLDDTCNRIVERALLSAQQKQYSEALQLYQAAFTMQPEPRLFLSIGRMQQKLGRFAESQKSYQQFLKSSTRVDDQAYRSKALEWMKEIEDQISIASPQSRPSSPPLSLSPTHNSSARPAKKPIYRKWWFWTIMGAGVAGIAATGITLGLVLRKPDNNRPSGAVSYCPFSMTDGVVSYCPFGS